MLEIELKASLEGIDRSDLEATLLAAGFQKQEMKEETDIYYNGCNRDFRKTDEALRLRSSRVLSSASCPSQTFITYKGSKVDDRSQTRPELETAVGDLEIMKALLEKLGYPVVMTVRKVRVYYQNGNVTACLDEVDGLGAFLELEQIEPMSIEPIATPDEKKEAIIDQLLLLLVSLGVPKENLLRQSYLELLMIRS